MIAKLRTLSPAGERQSPKARQAPLGHGQRARFRRAACWLIADGKPVLDSVACFDVGEARVAATASAHQKTSAFSDWPPSDVLQLMMTRNLDGEAVSIILLFLSEGALRPNAYR
jgi:hypothetical protein